MVSPREVLIDSLGSSLERWEEREIGFDVYLSWFSNPTRIYIDESITSFSLSDYDEASTSSHESRTNLLKEYSDEDMYSIRSKGPETQINELSHPIIAIRYIEDLDLFVIPYISSDVLENGPFNYKAAFIFNHDAVERARKLSMGIATRDYYNERVTLLLCEEENVWFGILTRIAVLGIKRLLDNVLPAGWDESPARAQQLELVTWQLLSSGDTEDNIKEQRREAQKAVAERLGVEYETVRSKSGEELWETEPYNNYQTDFFDPILIELQSLWSYDFLESIVWPNEENPPLYKMLADLPPTADELSGSDSNRWTDPSALTAPREVGEDEIFGLNREESDGANLHYPDELHGDRAVTERIDAALRSGDHLILTGPPGSGKTELAAAICEHYREDAYEVATATSDWSTFDTIGGYRQKRDGDGLRFTPGLFLERFRTDDDGTAVNEWLVIDELNRANIDEAFGSLFTVLTGETVTLPFFVESDSESEADDPEEHRVEIHGDPTEGDPIQPHRYYVPSDWRLIATMNSVDKASLYRMSYAFMRRFSFVTVPVPTADVVSPELVGEYLDCWDNIEPSDYDVSEVDLDGYNDFETKLREDIALIWEVALDEGGDFGPGVIRDVLEHALAELQTTGSLGYDQALAAHLLPQFEGQKDSEVEDVLRRIENSGAEGLTDALDEIEDATDTTVSRQFAASHLGVDLDDLGIETDE